MFTARLMMSNPKMWRYNLIWDKVGKTGFLNANRMPLRQHEDICVFYDRQPTYHPQMVKCEPHKRNHSRGNNHAPCKNSCYGSFVETPTIITDEKFPGSIITIPKEHKNGSFYHPTQKSVALLEYLIRTYSNEGDTVLDATMGSGSTMVACVNTLRRGIGIELNDEYFAIAEKRVREAKAEISSRLF
jgi:site-specific DNA-methyltransferase (adenine-specific)/modification methylase